MGNVLTKVSVNGVVYDLGGSGGGTIIETTYEELKSMISSSELVTGNKYRITDYVTEFKNWKSAGHQFDVVVEATSSNQISNKAEAMLHEGDPYFSESRLQDWEIWYDIDNDSNLSPQAKTGAKGCIYRMIDEFGNDAPYDFKNALRTLDNSQAPWVTSEEGSLDFYTFSIKDGSKITDATLKVSNAFVRDNVIRWSYSISGYLTTSPQTVVCLKKPVLKSSFSYNKIDSLTIYLGGATESNNNSFIGNIKSISAKGIVSICNSTIKASVMSFDVESITNCDIDNTTWLKSKSLNYCLIKGINKLTIEPSIYNSIIIGSFPTGNNFILSGSEKLENKLITNDSSSVRVIDIAKI